MDRPSQVPIGELDVLVTAPGKIILSGEHSVVYAKCPAIAASINKRCRCRLSTVQEKVITVVLQSLDHTFQISLEDFNTLELLRLKENLVETITVNQEKRTFEIKNAITVILFLVRVIVFYVTTDPVGLKSGLVLTISSDLVLGAGSGSSAAFAVCVAGAAYTLGRWILEPVASGTTLARQVNEEFYTKLECVLQCGVDESMKKQAESTTFISGWESINSFDRDMINFFAFHGERITHGKPSGLDNSICTYGGLVKLRRQDKGDNDLDKIEHIYPLEILLVDTGVSRSTANLVKKVADLKERHEILFSQLLKTFTCVTEEFANTLVTMSTVEQVEVDFKKLEDLVVMNQGLLAALGVSHPKLNHIIDICNRHGLQAKLTGAGGGGFAFALVPPGYDRQRLEVCVQELEGKGFAVSSGIKLGGDGVEMEIFKSKRIVG